MSRRKKQEQHSESTNVVKFTKKLTELIAQYGEGDDFLVYHSIPADKQKNARETYRIPKNEEIYGLIDTTVWGSAKEGLAFCTSGIYWNLDGAPGFISFDELTKFDFHPDFDDDDDDDDEPNDDLLVVAGEAVVHVLTLGKDESMSTCIILEEIKKLKAAGVNYEDEISEYREKGDWEKVLEIYDQLLSVEKTSDNYAEKAYALYHLDRNDQAHKTLQTAYELFFDTVGGLEKREDWNDDARDSFALLKQYEAFMAEAQQKTAEALWAYCEAYANNTDKEVKLQLKEERDSVYEQFVKSIPAQKYNDRKVIFIAQELPAFRPATILPLKLDNYGDLKFPPGHPVAGQLYVGHPFKENLYYPVDDYENELFQAQVMEFNHLMQCLGATLIETTHIKGSQLQETTQARNVHDSSRSRSGAADGDMRLNTVGSEFQSKGHAYSDRSNLKQTARDSGKQMATRQTFAPRRKAFIPDDLLWYQHSETWQRLVKQRLQGGLLNCEMVISTQNVEQLKENEKRQLKADYENMVKVAYRYLLLRANVQGSSQGHTDSITDIERALQKGERTDWKIRVEFAPLEQLIDDSTSLPQSAQQLATTSPSTLSDNEQDYIEMIQDALEDDGQISADEKRMLEKRREKMGISKERAVELEQTVLNKSKFTPEELEYLEDLKDAMENDGQISTDERRMLEKRRAKLNISAERAREIEESLSR